ncbi:nuclear transport factor 2 family protein [Agromyces aerolatus]|uniref:nuclear transport factor 2 family protein n=1 Tax=Agromyces sp. LY-1074 TaxID=3074080 RepID=UPI00285F480B|nr:MULTISPECIES: nuclear transport factor 2 family protein [unclassified Agromyces]MDR5699647.1 nuclear transport factor 2 family protein [Agromyces sp. LY-1074]MDR5705943.1 nuclear transport factor 2 family protein [Agromyces sp. LY-1358]
MSDPQTSRPGLHVDPLPGREPTRDEVLAAAAEVVAAFAATDGDRYFAGFAPDATFVFHAEPARLDDRAAYERLWAGWVEGGWRVLSCESTNRLVQTFPGGAVFSHDVATAVDTGDGEDRDRERETIVFRADGDGLIAIHEHLSPAPAEASAAPDA